MGVAFQIGSIVLAVVLIILILLQVKGGALGSLMGDAGGGIARTRRGLEKTLFNITIGISVAFLVICILSVITNSTIS